jgi:hypothetical protein
MKKFVEAAGSPVYSAVQDYVIGRVASAPLRPDPFPHFYAESIFPADYYAELRRRWPEASQLVSIGSTGRVTQGAYPERFVMPLSPERIGALPEEARPFWNGFAQWMLASDRFFSALMDKFEPYLRERFGAQLEEAGFSSEVLVVRDHTNYQLGPHTDSPHRVMSLLFYCPDDDAYSHLGTSIYTPVDPGFRCTGGPHHARAKFTKYATMEYKPNTLFAFFKTDHSFHGVEPVQDAHVLRDLILYDIQGFVAPVEPKRESDQQPKQQPNEVGGALGLRILKNILRRPR